MQSVKLMIMLFIISIFLVACNLGVDDADDTATVLEQATIVLEQPTRNPLPTMTAIPEINTRTPEQINNSNITPFVCDPRTDWGTYTVIAGDTLSRIAARGNTTVNTLSVANCLADPNRIEPNQILRVPNPVVAASPIVMTSTPMPALPINTNCRLIPTKDVAAYSNQTYLPYARLLNAGVAYTVTGQNQWNYRIQYSATQEVWVQRNSVPALQGNCNNVFEVSLSYGQLRTVRYNICYFVPEVANFNTYVDQAQTMVAGTLDNTYHYMIDAHATNQYRIVSGSELLPFPSWTSASNGRLEGNCNDLPDLTIANTRNAPLATFEITDWNIAFDYPSNWRIIDSVAGMGGYITGTMPYTNGFPAVLGLPNDVVDVRLVYLALDETPIDYATRVANQIIANPSRVSVLQTPQAITLPSGLAAAHYVLDMMNAEYHEYVFEIDGILYSLIIHGQIDLAQPIIDSLRQD